MFDLTADLQTFYDNHVRLGTERRKALSGYRDLNVTRLKGGLDDLAEETARPHSHPYAVKNQGGYAMHTLNQDPRGDNSYDIDVALLFLKDALPEDPLKARQRICAALAKRCTNFTKEPEARTNAVTVWYGEGYHIDFAVYRTYTDALGTERVEHASTEWKRRDPMEVNNWFTERVGTLSPKASPLFGYYPKVADGQMRRVVRFLKWFSRSRSSWSLPGGMVISALVAETYRPNPDRDDRALYDTMVALRDRLNISCQVWNPVDSTQELTGNDEVLHQVERLRDNLGKAIGRLAILFDQKNCTREKGRFAWDWVFNHEFWATKETLQKASVEATTGALVPYAVAIRCDLARKEKGPTYMEYRSNSAVLPKGVHLKFSVVSTNVLPPYEVRWIVRNEGDEAREENQLFWERNDTGLTHWTSTRFKGCQTMTCQIEKDGRVLARAVHVVRIAPGGGWRRK